MRLATISFAISLMMHASVLWLLPHYLNVKDTPLLTTVVVELLEKTPGEPESSLQSSPEGAKAKPVEGGEREADQGKKTSSRAAEAGRAAEKAGALPPKRPPLNKSEPLTLQNPPKATEPKPAELPPPPDPAVGKALEATMRLDDTDRRYKGFLEGVRGAVDAQWNSRDAMIEAQRSGIVTLGFTLTAAGGRAARVEVVKSSDSGALDNEALRAVKAASFPPFPRTWRLERLHLVGQFDYSFNSGE